MKVCAVCGAEIRGKVATLPKPYAGKPAHWRCLRLVWQRNKWGEPDAQRLGEAKARHKAAVKRFELRGDDRHGPL